MATIKETDMDAKRDEEGMEETEPEYEAIMERKGKRHPNDFDIWPSNEQCEAFKRGGR